MFQECDSTGLGLATPDPDLYQQSLKLLKEKCPTLTAARG